MDSEGNTTKSPLARWLGLAAVLVIFGLPLFHGLGNLDMHNDEASYSYGVQRIIETDNWLTIRGTPDQEFLEKPPLKFWLVAGAIRLGLIANDDAGLRSLDAFFGMLIFAYVYLLAHRAHGVIAGVGAVWLAFTFQPLIFDHGLRSNNMEAALTLAYCAGFYHVLSWIEASAVKTARRHAFAASLAFVLGFMTKFVMIVFLPAGAVLLVLLHPTRRSLLRLARLRDWLVPAILTLALVVPWFAYQTVRVGTRFWDVILGQQVLRRASSGLDPSHLEPPLFYVTRIVTALTESGTLWLVVAGLAWCLSMSIRREGTIARLLLFWAIAPLTLLSMSHSKIVHYAYPFVPPLMIAGGWVLGLMTEWFGRAFLPDLRRVVDAFPIRRALLVVAALSLTLAAATWLFGRLVLHLPHEVVISNSSVWRPLALATALVVGVVRTLRSAAVAPATLAIVTLLPVNAYARTVRQTAVVYRPLASLNSCIRSLNASGNPVVRGTYLGSGYPPTHAYYYYLREFGPYTSRVESDDVQAEVEGRLSSAPPELVMLSSKDYVDRAARIGTRTLPAFTAENDFVLMLPGEVGTCQTDAIAKGALRANPPQ